MNRADEKADKTASTVTYKTAHQARPPRGFRENPSTSQLSCPHRDVTCCPACLKANPEIVEVGGQCFWTSSEREKKELLREMGKTAHGLIDHELVNDLASAYRGKKMRDGIRDMEMAGMPEQVAERFYDTLGEQADEVRGELHRMVEEHAEASEGCDCGSDCPCLKQRVAAAWLKQAIYGDRYIPKWRRDEMGKDDRGPTPAERKRIEEESARRKDLEKQEDAELVGLAREWRTEGWTHTVVKGRYDVGDQHTYKLDRPCEFGGQHNADIGFSTGHFKSDVSRYSGNKMGDPKGTVSLTLNYVDEDGKWKRLLTRSLETTLPNTSEAVEKLKELADGAIRKDLRVRERNNVVPVYGSRAQIEEGAKFLEDCAEVAGFLNNTRDQTKLLEAAKTLRSKGELTPEEHKAAHRMAEVFEGYIAKLPQIREQVEKRQRAEAEAKARAEQEAQKAKEEAERRRPAVAPVEEEAPSDKLAGKSFCFTGAMKNKRADLEALVVKHGGTVKSSVTKGLTYLVMADPNSGSSKAEAARKLGTVCISEEDFLKMVGTKLASGSAARVVNRFLRAAAKPVDMKKVVEKLARATEKAFKGQQGVGTTHVSLKSKAGFEVGEVYINGGQYRIRIVGIVQEGNIGIGADSGPHTLASLGSRGPATDAAKRLKKPVEFLLGMLAEEAAKAAPVTPKGPSLDAVRGRLRSTRLGPGGSVQSVEELSPTEWSVEPRDRKRLDHYGNGGEGWDDEGWQRDYAGPMSAAAEKWLEAEFGKGLFGVDVDEKGYVFIFLTADGKKHFGV
jgi:hypothetical protein